MELNHTCLELLKILYEQRDYIPIRTLAERMEKTERSIRYSLDLVDEFLKRKKLPFLSRKFGCGVYLEHTPEMENTLKGFLTDSTPYQYKFSTEAQPIYSRDGTGGPADRILRHHSRRLGQCGEVVRGKRINIGKKIQNGTVCTGSRNQTIENMPAAPV